jgi:hypothetical protein
MKGGGEREAGMLSRKQTIKHTYFKKLRMLASQKAWLRQKKTSAATRDVLVTERIKASSMAANENKKNYY